MGFELSGAKTEVTNNVSQGVSDSIGKSAEEARQGQLQSEVEYQIQEKIYNAMHYQYQIASSRLSGANGPNKSQAQRDFNLAKTSLFSAETNSSIARDHYQSATSWAGKMDLAKYMADSILGRYA